MATNQVIDRASKHVKDVIPTQEKREAEVEARIATRTDTTLITENKASKGKTSTP